MKKFDLEFNADTKTCSDDLKTDIVAGMKNTCPNRL